MNDRAERYQTESHTQTPGQRAAISKAVASTYQADRLPTVIAERHVPIWLIEDLLLDDTLDVIVGAEGTGKSFLAIDMAMCVSHGLRYHGKRTEQRPVLYIAGEGRAGV